MTYETNEHHAIITSDDRGRFNLGKWVAKGGPYKVYLYGDGAVLLRPAT